MFTNMNIVHKWRKLMFATFRTLFEGASARAEENVRKTYSIELIDQKIREAVAGLKTAKVTLAGFMQRQRSEERQIADLDQQIADLTERTRQALEGDREDLATEAAEAIARLEDERTMRAETRDRLERRIVRLRSTVETVNRRISDLKQGAAMARAARSEHRIQRKLNTTLSGQDAMGEAEELIGKVLSEDDPFEQSLILEEIDSGISGQSVSNRMADQGFGPARKSSGAAVLERLKAEKKKPSGK